MKSVGCYRGLDECVSYLSEEGQKKRKKSLRKLGVFSTVFAVAPWLAVVFSAGFTFPIILLLGLWDLIIYLFLDLVIKRDSEYEKDAKNMLKRLLAEIRAEGIDVSILNLTKRVETASVETCRTFGNKITRKYAYVPENCETKGNMKTYYSFDDNKGCTQVLMVDSNLSCGSSVSSESYLLEEEDKEKLGSDVKKAVLCRVLKPNDGKNNK